MPATATRKPAQKPARRVNISRPVNGVHAVHMTIGTGEKAKHFGYYIASIPADFGLGFYVEKFATEQVEGEEAIYHVNIDLTGGHHSCTCKGGTYCGHCKHQEAILALLKSGKIQASQRRAKPEPKPAPMPADEHDTPVLYCPECRRHYLDRCECGV